MQTILRSVMGNGSQDAAKKFADQLRKTQSIVRLRDVASRAGKVGAHSTGVEGVTEMAQSFIDQMAMMDLDPETSMSLRDLDLVQLVDSGIRGAIFGGTLGTGGSTVTGVSAMRRNLKAETNRTQQDELGDAPASNLDDTSAEPLEDLLGNVESRGSVWISPRNMGEFEEVYAALEAQGEVTPPQQRQ